MAGFDNEVMFALGERLQQSTSQAIMLMQQTATDVSNVNFTGDPNGSVSANPSSLCHDPVSGDLWLKSTGTGNTGWIQLSGSSSVTLTADDTNSLTGNAFNLFGQKAGTVPVMDTLVSGGNFLFEDRTWKTQYVVDPSATAGLRGTYQTIAAAIAAAVADGAAYPANFKRIFIRFGTYTENLTIPGGIIFEGEAIPNPNSGVVTPYQTTVINGNHVYTGVAVNAFQNISFISSSGTIFSPSSPSAILYFFNECFMGALDGTSQVIDTTGVLGTYLSFYDCDIAGTPSQTQILMPSGGNLKMVDCNYPQSGIINVTGVNVTLVDVIGIGEITGSPRLDIQGCKFQTNFSTYNISGTAQGIIKNCYFNSTLSAAIQNTCTCTLIGCWQGGVGSGNVYLYETGCVYPQAIANQGNVMQSADITISFPTPYTFTNNVYCANVNNTVTGGQILLETTAKFNQGQVIVIKDSQGNAATNPIEITSSTGILIDGQTSIFLDDNYGSYTLRFNGTNFNVIGKTGTSTANATLASGSAISLTTATPANVVSISLNPGTWVVTGLVEFGGTPTVSGPQQVSVNTISATHGTIGDNSVQNVMLTTNFTVGFITLIVPSYILTVANVTTCYLIASGVFGGTMTAFGRISAVKIA